MFDSLAVTIIYILGSYIVGSIPSGLLVGKIWKGVDVRQEGSGRTGATNILRTLGFKAALIVTLMDLSKGFLTVYLYGSIGETSIQAIGAFAVLLGHIWPIFAGFKGGRGVMPAIGISIDIVPISGVIGVTIGALIIIIWRYVSLGSLIGTMTACSLVIILSTVGNEPKPFALLAAAVCILIIFTHRDNIERLRNGTELRFKNSSS